jgi:hypothetical protein
VDTNKKTKKKLNAVKESSTPNLSASPLENYDVEKRLYDTLNSLELKKSMDKWLKTNEGQHATVIRDLSILKGINEEYLNSFLVLGYTLEGERVILQSYSCPKDKDALMEFLKVVFIQNHNSMMDD